MRRYRNVLVVVGGRPSDRSALRRGLELSGRNDARLRVLDIEEVVTPRLWSLTGRQDLADAVLADRAEEVTRWVRSVVGDVDGIDVDVQSSPRPHVTVVETVLEHGHDIVVLSGMSALTSIGLSSTALHLLRKSPVPVWVTRSGTTLDHLAVAVGLDEGEESGGALDLTLLEMGSSLARDVGARLTVVHAWRLYGESLLRSSRRGLPPSEIERLRAEEEARARVALSVLLDTVDTTGVDVDVQLLHGRADQQLVHFVQDHEVDMLVLGAVDRGGLPGVFVSNTTEEVLQSVRCAVMVVKPHDFTSPVRADGVAQTGGAPDA